MTSSTRPLERAKEGAGVKTDAEIGPASLRKLVEELKEVVVRGHRQPVPARLRRTSSEAPSKPSSSPGTAPVQSPTALREHIPHDLGTAVNVQAMVFGNRDDNSGTGVGFTRDPATGANGAYGDFLVNAQGEDVVAGIRNTEPLSALRIASRPSTPS